jgi:hypothetical protein
MNGGGSRQNFTTPHRSTWWRRASISRLKAEASNSKGAGEAYEEIKASLREAQTEIRIFTYLLHPPKLDSLGLKKTMETFIERGLSPNRNKEQRPNCCCGRSSAL